MKILFKYNFLKIYKILKILIKLKKIIKFLFKDNRTNFLRYLFFLMKKDVIISVILKILIYIICE